MKTRSIIIVVWVVLAHQVAAQRIQRFEGKVPLQGDSAFVIYNYYEQKGKKLLHNDFVLEAQRTLTNDSLAFQKTAWRGSFSKGVKEGLWRYDHFNHYIAIDAIEDFKISSTLQSEQSTLNAMYNKGVPEGTWKFRTDEYLQGERKRTLAEVLLPFKEGQLNGIISAQSLERGKPVLIKGNVNEKGFLHGEWDFTYWEADKQITEHRLYQNGFLIYLLQQNADGDTLRQLNFDHVRANLKVVEDKGGTVQIADEKFSLLFDLGYGTNAPELQWQKRGNELIEKLVSQALRQDTAFSSAGRPVIGTARFYYLSTTEEETNWRNIRQYADSIQGAINSIRNKKFFEVNNQRSDSLAWSYDYIKLYQSRLKEVRNLIEFGASPLYRLVDPAIYFRHHADFMKSADTVRYNYDGEEKRRTISYRNVSINSLPDLVKRLEEDRDLMATLVRNVNRELERVVKSDKLERIENLILTSFEQTSALFAAVTDSRARKVVQQFQNQFLDNQYNRYRHAYTSENNYDQKEQTAYEIIQFLADAANLPERVEKICLMRDSIDRAYTQSKLDPYTFNVVETKVKRKLYEKVALELTDFLLADVSSETELADVEKKLTDLELVQRKLIEFLEADTTSLERKIKPKSSPEEIKILLGI